MPAGDKRKEITAPDAVMSGDDVAVKILTTQDILSAPDLREETVFIPQWGGSVRIRSITRAQRNEARRRSIIKGELDPDRMEMYLLIAGVVEPVFTLDMAGAMLEKSAGAFELVLRRIMELSGLTEEAIKEAEHQLQF